MLAPRRGCILNDTACIRRISAWFLVRLSGTEPVMRFYAESKTEADLDQIIADGKKLILG